MSKLKFEKFKNEIVFKCAFFLLLIFLQFGVEAQNSIPLRRPISPSSPMWLIHIDTWNYADPQKIINLIPPDIRPYVVMNISLSISHDVTPTRFKVAEYGYEIARSWVRTCAENQMWAMVQPASGGMHQLAFPEDDLSVYEEFFRDYPNFLGFNYCEQFWGFDDVTDPVSAKWTDRITHFADLLKLSNKYGGYLVVSWCGNQWGPSINPIGMLKRNSAFAAACKQYTENYILCEKYTQTSYISDVESICLGVYLSGYSGNYGIRYDNTGWTDANGTNSNFTLATAGAPHLEHIMLTGQTVIDGPELIWTQCFKENSTSTTNDGYTKRNWSTFSRFDNVMVDIFRKILDGTIRIPSRKEVIDRTKVVVVNDINSGDNNATYSSPQTLFEGLYRMDGDGNYENNKTFFKKTGRYPTIPAVYQLDDADANSFQVKVNKSGYEGRWPSIASKVTEFNNLFPQEYTGDLYAGRHENGWVTYNPYKTGQTAKGSIPFKYNTSDHMDLVYSQYTSGVIREYVDKVTFYLCNYDEEVNTGLKSDTIKIYGSSSEPTWTYIERGNHQASVITKDWTSGVFTLTIKHNGSVDITINCSGTATGRSTDYTPATLTSPVKPPLYNGPRQYEAECFDRKSISSVVTSGYSGSIRNYTGQGYTQFGTNAAASLRDTVNVLKNGIYKLDIRYSAASGAVTTIDLYVNGTKVTTPTFSQTATESDWAVNSQYIALNAGSNSIMFKANAAGAYGIVFDNMVISKGNNATMYDFTNDTATSSASVPPAQFMTLQSGTAGVVSYTDASNKSSNCFKTYSVGTSNGTGVTDLDLFPSLATDYYVVWKEYYGTTGAKKGILLRGNGACAYATGMKQGYLCTVENNKDNTVTLKTYLADATGIMEKTSYTTGFQVFSNKPCWYRAMVIGSNVVFECSGDSTTWVGGNTTAFTDGTYTSGATQLVWGFGTNNFNWVADDIACKISTISASRYALNGFTYSLGSGPSQSQTFTVSGNSLTDNVLVNAPDNYEVSLSSGSGYSTSLVLTSNDGVVLPTSVYIRLKAGLGLNASYNGAVSISSNPIASAAINLSGSVTPAAVSKIYNFSNDVAAASASTPPALNTAIGAGNSATAGVVSITDSKGITSNMLKPYSGGNRNGTGVIDLPLFSKKSTDYSVTWKQCVGTISKDYKVGMLLRGDTSKIGDASTGYVQGLMQGYIFLPYTVGAGGTQFRIYKSTSSTSLTTLTNITISSLTPTVNQPVWYRASVSGSTSVALKIEYSTDSTTWNTGASYTDASAVFTSGATQFVWGVATNNFDHYLDNVGFNGIEQGLPASASTLTVSLAALSGFGTYQNMGPSAGQSFIVSGTLLTNNVVVTAPANYEISLNPLTGYTSSCTIVPSSGNVATTLYVRLQSGLAVNSYTGNITIESTGVTGKAISLSGTVSLQATVSISTSSLSGFSYPEGHGPSAAQSFSVSGSSLTDNIIVNAPEHYEISLSDGTGYASSLTLTQSGGSVSPTDVYVRLRSGLPANVYNEEIFTSSAGAVKQSLSLNATGIVVSSASISGLDYIENSGPSVAQSFTVSGISLNSDVTITSPVGFEISLSSNSGYALSLVLTQSNGTVSSTTVYVRLKSGLSAAIYSGNITISSTGSVSTAVSLSGAVNTATDVVTVIQSSATVVSQEYYTLMGQRIYDIEYLRGIYIVKTTMSDGTIKLTKVWLDKK